MIDKNMRSYDNVYIFNLILKYIQRNYLYKSRIILFNHIANQMLFYKNSFESIILRRGNNKRLTNMMYYEDQFKKYSDIFWRLVKDEQLV